MTCQEKQTCRKAACWFTESSCTIMHFLIDASQMAPRQLATGNTLYRIKLTFPERIENI
jgi:hypothetical protein